MTCTAKIKPAWRTPLRTSDHVNYSTLDVDVASKSIHPTFVKGNVRIHWNEHNKHASSAQA